MKLGILSYLVLVGSLIADESSLDGMKGPLIQVTVEYIEVSQQDATRLLYKEKLGLNGAKLRAELQTMLDAGQAKPFETLMTSTLASQKATAESVREVIYPTEYEPPELPQEVAVDKETLASPNTVKALAGLVTPETPTAFETRNTGNTLEVHAMLEVDKKTIMLRLVPELVIDTGIKKFNARKDSTGNDLFMEMPLFYSIRLNTQAAMTSGVPLLVALQTPNGADGTPDRSRKLMVIVTAEIGTSATSE